MSIFLSELGQIVFYVANYFLLFAAGAVGSVRRGKTSLKAEPSKSQRISSRINGLLLILGPLIAASFGYAGIGLLLTGPIIWDCHSQCSVLLSGSGASRLWDGITRMR